MAGDRDPQFSELSVGVRQLLGHFGQQDSIDWAPLRSTQIYAGGQHAPFMLAANMIALVATILILLQLALPLRYLVSWGVLVVIISTGIAWHRRTKCNRHPITASPSEVSATVLDGISLGAAWSIAPLAVVCFGNTEAMLSLWIVLSLLMTAGAVAMAALPLAAVSFIAILGGSIAAALYLITTPPLVVAATLFAVLLVLVSYGRGKALVVIRAGEISLAERDETVSLLLREFQDQNGDWLWETDADRRVIHASPRFARSFGLDPASINGLPFLQVLAGPTWEAGNFTSGLRELAKKMKCREGFRDLLLPVRVNGEEHWFEIAATPRFDEYGTYAGFRGVGSDVTEQRASADKINRMARFDALTGLPNRLLVNEALAYAMAEAEKWRSRCAFMMIDLDRFKAVNDTLGHPIGDRLLGRVSERLGQLVTENEVIGRLGGDEFAVVVRDASDSLRCERLAQAIIDTLSRPYELDEHTLYIGASVGVAFSPRDGRTAELLVRSADLALYRSKESGGGVFHCYEPQLHVAAEERRVLEVALRSAAENGQMHLSYQPVVLSDTGALVGFEALLRWTHPEFGTISPAKFVPLAEDTRLIEKIGGWVLRSACAEAACWSLPIRIAINVSSEQLHNPAFVTLVSEALAESGLPAERLELEVTESVFMREGTHAIHVLDQLLDLGVKLSLDDFGTGYSSLGYLARTRFSTIKIDRSFVQGASKGSKEAIAIIRAVVALANSLDMATTAEGVESEDEYKMVQVLGCSKVQGYYFGRPLPVQEARALMSLGHGKNVCRYEVIDPK